MTQESESSPSSNGDNGRLQDGRFAKGNPGGPGNPHAAAVGRWRNTLTTVVTAEDLQEIVRVLVAKAKAGEHWAVREVLDRCLGKPKPPVEVEPPDAQQNELPSDYLQFLDERAANVS